jgi:hypothetical protein
MDVVIPIVFPEYRVAVETPPAEVDLFPWWSFDDIKIGQKKLRMSQLGHAGVLFIEGRTGVTKYYEYGRYDYPELRGAVRRLILPNAASDHGVIIRDSLRGPLAKISQNAGQGGRIEGCYIEVTNKYQAMLNYAEQRKMQNSNARRKPYDLTFNSCIHFVKEVVAAAGVDTPWMVDPRPNSYIGEFRDDFPNLDYRPAAGKLVIEQPAVA